MLSVYVISYRTETKGWSPSEGSSYVAATSAAEAIEKLTTATLRGSPAKELEVLTVERLGPLLLLPDDDIVEGPARGRQL